MDTTEDNSTPNIDDQVAQISMLMQQPPQDGQKGYLISGSWLKKVLARSSTHADKADKEALQSELGPVDNSDIVLDLGPQKRDFKDEKGDPFVPLRPGLQFTEDYQVVPQEAWDLIMKWYGRADQSPVMVRYAHNTNPDADGLENIMYELNPPIYTIFKLSNPAAGTTPQVLREKNLPPAKVLAARDTRYMKWLKEAKQLAGIEMASKVRVWKIMGGIPSAEPSTATTPAVSRTASPAPTSSLISNQHKSLVLDLSTFLGLNESCREKIEIQDQTNNANYNGKMSMSMAGLVGTDVVVLEEQVAGSKGGKWVSEASHQALQRAGLSAEKAEKPEKAKKQLATAAATTSTANSPATSGRSSPVAEIPRGRKKGGRPMGLTGLSNLGNTCYQNAATQCLRAVEELSYYFMSMSRWRYARIH
jgi:ubiquitin carboxyl-terminal hydrolase 4/11/15